MVPSLAPFQLLGFGHRRKLLYRSGWLQDALTGELLRHWEPRSQRLEPAEYRVTLHTGRGEVVIQEDEQGVWLTDHGERTLLTQAPVKLPRFDDHPRAGLMRVLHGEILLNVLPHGPVPNLWVYPRPWYRDAATMAMVLRQTGNLGLIEPWIGGLTKVYDRNNAGVAEADNPGQALFLVSLVSDRRHGLVEPALKELRKLETGKHIRGLSDYAEHPVYQTKWAKLGLRSLGLEDPYEVPSVADSYSSLFWMDFRTSHVPHPRFGEGELRHYPYLNWAEAHFYDEPPPAEMPDPPAGPITWEAKASEADYGRMRLLGEELVKGQVCTPHTWHAGEAFLYWVDRAGTAKG